MASQKDVKDYLEACGWTFDKGTKKFSNEGRNQTMNGEIIQRIIEDSETTLDAIHRIDLAIDAMEPVKSGR
jgi:hypothetical protein